MVNKWEESSYPMPRILLLLFLVIRIHIEEAENMRLKSILVLFMFVFLLISGSKADSPTTTDRYLPKFFVDQDLRDYFFECLSSNEFEKAESLLRSQQSKSPNDPSILGWLADLRFQVGDIDSAFEYCEQAIELDPGYAHAYFDRGSLYLNLEEYGLALVDLRKAVEIDPHYSEFQLALGAALLATGNIEESLTYLATAVSFDQDSATAKFYLAAAYAQGGYQEKADELIQRILTNHPESYEAQALREQMGY